VETTTATASLVSNPTRQLDTRLYYNYYDRSNSSTQILFQSPALGCPPPGCLTELFEYKKQNAGVEVGWRFGAQNRLVGLIDYTHSDQHRADYPITNQWTYGLS